MKRKTNFSKKKIQLYIKCYNTEKNSFLAEITFQEIFKLKLMNHGTGNVECGVTLHFYLLILKSVERNIEKR